VSKFVIDGSIAIKWVAEEEGTPEALTLRQKAALIAPDLLVPECANILWKKVQRHELLVEEAPLAARPSASGCRNRAAAHAILVRDRDSNINRGRLSSARLCLPCTCGRE
jgi:hypothetical protein